jgi:FKBP-type peptidyl-prolyl cis-trans isomerase
MKSRQICFLVIGLLSCGAAAQDRTPATNPPGATAPSNAAPAPAKPAEKPEKKDYSHALGIMYAQGVTNDMVQKRFGLDPKADLDLGVFFEAFSNVVVGTPMSTNMVELRKILLQDDAYQKERILAEEEKLKATGPENKVKGEKFMDDIAKAPGVTKLASGVVYKVIKDGDGDKPLSTDVATLDFRVSQVDGTEVWKIEHTPVLVSHPLLPPGMKEALPMMKAGSHWTLYLPYTQAYGEQSGIPDPKHGFKVGPCSALIIDVEMEPGSIQHPPGPPPTRLPPGLMPGGAPPPPPAATATPPAAAATPAVTSSSIVRVPSAEEAARGEQPRVLTDAEIEAEKAKAAQRDATNATPK